MIDQEQRKALLDKLKKGDLADAVKIYEKNTARKINRTMLEKFIKGLYPFRGRNPNAHNPAQMFNAIAEAVAERQRRERQYSEDARRRLTELIMRDTSPHQPMPL